MDEIKKFIESEIYNELLNKVRMQVKIEVNELLPPIVLLNHDASLLKAAKITIGEISDLISKDDKVSQFIIAKMTFYETHKEVDNNEYPEGEELEDDELPVVKKTLPYYKNFMFGFLLEYYFLKNRPSELISYLKATKMPHAKKYENELKEIHNKL